MSTCTAQHGSQAVFQKLQGVFPLTTGTVHCKVVCAGMESRPDDAQPLMLTAAQCKCKLGGGASLYKDCCACAGHLPALFGQHSRLLAATDCPRVAHNVHILLVAMAHL